MTDENDAMEYRKELHRRLDLPVKLKDGPREPTLQEREYRAMLIYLHEGPDVFMHTPTAAKIIEAMVAHRYPGVKVTP